MWIDGWVDGWMDREVVVWGGEWIDGGLLGGWVDECVDEGTSANA